MKLKIDGLVHRIISCNDVPNSELVEYIVDDTFGTQSSHEIPRYSTKPFRTNGHTYEFYWEETPLLRVLWSFGVRFAVSRRSAEQLIENYRIKVNGGFARNPEYLVKAGDRIELFDSRCKKIDTKIWGENPF